MLFVITQLIGGIGLFLLGMTLMTDSLKAMAGESLRRWLARFTGSPLKAMFSGIGFTLVVQSSTATTLATIGFVSAGVLSFAQAIGVIIGANIGTTSTGWMVAFLGLKFSITAFALPMIGIGAMLKLLGKDIVALFGLALAGFGLLFFGIDVLQDAMASFAEKVDLSVWSNESLSTQFILVIIGLVMTVLLQSSSAAVTATLAALASQAIDLPQALALVIGQNIGTVATAILAAVGATVSAQRTAAVHVVFNVVTAVFAFFILMPMTLWLVNHQIMFSVDDTVVIAAFHTAFSLMGAIIFMPLIKQFQWVIEKILPEKSSSSKQSTNTRYLDDSLFSMPAVAISAAKGALCQSLVEMYQYMAQAGKGEITGESIDTTSLDEVLFTVDKYLKDMPVPQAQADQRHLIALLRLVVYSRVVREDLQHTYFLDTLRVNFDDDLLPLFIKKIEDLIPYLKAAPIQGVPQEVVQEFMAFGKLIKAVQDNLRLSIVMQSAHIQTNAAEALDLIVAQRWLERLTRHTAKMIAVLQEQTEVEAIALIE